MTSEHACSPAAGPRHDRRRSVGSDWHTPATTLVERSWAAFPDRQLIAGSGPSQVRASARETGPSPPQRRTTTK
jgi:hypothetical protein